MKYVYAAVFEAAREGGYAVSFPDLPGCYSQGENLYDALLMAQSALKQWIEYLIDKNMTIPRASEVKDIKHSGTEFINLIHVEVKNNRAVKRTVSIPKWMDEKVAASGLSLSRVLQDALSQKLNMYP